MVNNKTINKNENYLSLFWNTSNYPLKRYRFFDIGNDHYYYDDYANETGMNEVAERSYIPALNTLIEMAKNSGGAFKVALSISGVALEQLEIHAPAVMIYCTSWMKLGVASSYVSLILMACLHWPMRIASVKKYFVNVIRWNSVW